MYHFLLRGASLHFPVQLFACSAAGLRGRLHMQLEEGASLTTGTMPFMSCPTGKSPIAIGVSSQA
jgi:hypothetical protein